jgi:predicted GNAT family acetyltransferase
MKEEYKSLDLLKNTAERRFEMMVDNYTAMITFEENAGAIKLLHTEVPEQLEGKGAATAIIEKTLDYIEKSNLKLVPLCPFVVAYIKRHPEWTRIMAHNKTHN